MPWAMARLIVYFATQCLMRALSAGRSPGGAPRYAFNLVRGPPRPGDHLAHPTLGLAVRRDHGERAEIVRDVLGGDGLLADAALGEGHVLGDRRVEAVADHELSEDP